MRDCRFLFNFMSSFSRKNVYGGETGVGCRVLGQEFTKLAKLDQRRVWVIEDIAFGQRSMADEHLIVLHEEGKIW